MATCFTDEPPAFPGAHHESRNKFHIYAVGVARYTVHGRTFTTTQTDIFPRGRLIHEASPWNVISIDFSSRRVTKDEGTMDKFFWNDEDVWRLQKGWTNDSVLETFLLFFNLTVVLWNVVSTLRRRTLEVTFLKFDSYFGFEKDGL